MTDEEFETKRAPEVRALTGIRGIAAFWVVTFHISHHQLLTGYAHTILDHGYLAVDLFFFLSGFVLALTSLNPFVSGFTWPKYGKFIGRRLARVWPLYGAAVVVAGALVWFGIIPTDGMHRSIIPFWPIVIANFFAVRAGDWPVRSPSRPGQSVRNLRLTFSFHF